MPIKVIGHLFFLSLTLPRVLIASKYDIVHIQGHVPAFFFFMPLLKLRRKQIFWTIHDVNLRPSYTGIKGDLEQLYMRTTTQPTILGRYADVIIVHSIFLKKQLASKGVHQNKIHVIPHFDYRYLLDRIHIGNRIENNYTESENRGRYVYSVLQVLLLFSHVYTWTIFTIVAVIFLLVLLKLNYYRKQSIVLLLLVVLSSVVIDVARTTITGFSGGIEADIAVSKSVGAGFNQFSLRWSNLVYATQVYLGGQLSNPIILVLCLYWLFRADLRQQSSIFIVVFFSLGFLPLFIGDIVIQSRVFYDIPFQIPAAIALTYLWRQSNGTLLLLPIGIWLIAISINAASNYYFVPP